MKVRRWRATLCPAVGNRFAGVGLTLRRLKVGAKSIRSTISSWHGDFPRKGAMNRTFSDTLRSVSPSSGLARGWLCGAPLARRCS